MKSRRGFDVPSLVTAATFVGLTACGRSSEAVGAPTIVTLGSAGNEPNGLAVDGTDVYWASVDWEGDGGASGAGTVQRVSADGGTVTVVGTGILPYAVAVDSTSVYWTDNPNGAESEILRALRGGGATTVLWTGPVITTGIVVDGANLYWGIRQDGGSLMKMPVGGGDVAVLATSPSANGLCPSGCIAVDSTNVYWAPSGSIMKVPLAGGPSVALATTTGLSSIAVAGDGVYWTEGSNVLRVGLDGAAATTIASYPNGSAGTLAVDSANAYWSGSTGSGNVIAKAPLGGGAPSTLVTLQVDGLGVLTALAVDAKSVYVATTLAGCNIGCAAVQKVTPK